jgi:hypothetical protein
MEYNEFLDEVFKLARAANRIMQRHLWVDTINHYFDGWTPEQSMKVTTIHRTRT